MMTKEARCSHCGPPVRGFTLIELGIVLAILALWAAVLVPGLARSRPTSEAAVCMNNLKQVMTATVMYTQDFQDRFPPNPDDGTTLQGMDWCQGLAGVQQAQEFNPDPLADASKCLLVPYLRAKTSVFHCTADRRVGLYPGTNPAYRGKYVLAARSISMSGAVGTCDAQYASTGAGHNGVPIVPVSGPWLTGAHGVNHHNSPWRTYGKTSDIVAPTPAGLFVFAEENPWSMNECSLQMSVQAPEWVDFPSDLHNQAGVIAFADNHVELHKWVGQSLRLTRFPMIQTVSSTDPDWLWMAQRTSVRAQ